MVDSQPQTIDSNILAFPQWICISGIGLMVIGVFAPAMGSGLGHMSLVYGGNTIAAIVLGVSAASAWSLNRRKFFRLLAFGVFTVAVIVSDLVSLWSIELNVSEKLSSFGFADRRLMANAWALILLGAILQASSAWDSRSRLNGVLPLLADSQSALWVRAVVRLIGLALCLMGVAAFANDIPSVRSAFRPFTDYLLVSRCVILALLVGTCLVSFANAPLLNILSRAMPRLVYGVLWGPVILFSLFLIATLQLDDFAAMIAPGIAFVATGEGIASHSYFPRIISAICNALILIGTMFVLAGGVPNEILAILGLARHEGVVVLALIVLWSLLVAVIQFLQYHADEHIKD
ncbi:MAG: hypothetical protein ACOVLE_16070 [Pirellula staleyi]